MTKPCRNADRVRSLSYNHQRKEIAVISLNGFIHCWNAQQFKQVGICAICTSRTIAVATVLTCLESAAHKCNAFLQVLTKKLPHQMENVCLATDEEAHMYAVGSKANTDLLDARTLQTIKRIPSRNNGCGIRSVSFKGNILTIGTGVGAILFWDLRAGKFLESTMNSNRAVTLKSSKQWLVSAKSSFQFDVICSTIRIPVSRCERIR